MVLSRHENEAIIIRGTGECRLVVIGVRLGGKGRPHRVRLGFEANSELVINREEIQIAIDSESRDGGGRA